MELRDQMDRGPSDSKSIGKNKVNRHLLTKYIHVLQ